MADHSMLPKRAYRVIVLVSYLVVIAAIVIGLLQLREMQLQKLDQPAARQQWQDWRDAAADQAGMEGSVQRRPPKATEPPALILLRDYFPTVLAASIVISSALFGFVAMAVHGTLKGTELPYVDGDPES
jgi:hypothetical protein